jgi:dihydroneopterin aldolase
MLANLTLKGIHFHAFHGGLEVERELGQVLELDVSLGYDFDPKDVGDRRDVPPDLPYARVYEEIQHVVMGTKFKAMEGLALTIAKRLFSVFPVLRLVTVIVRRKQLFIPGDIRSADVEITVDRDDLAEI